MKKKNLKQTILHKLPPKLPLNALDYSHNHLLRESSSFQPNQSEENRQVSGRSLINISNQKRTIIQPNTSKIKNPKLNRYPNQRIKRIQAPFATESTSIVSSRRVINRKQQDAKGSKKNYLNNVKTNINENISPRRFNDKGNKYSVNTNGNESAISSSSNKKVAVIQQTDFQNIDLPHLPSSPSRFKQSRFPKRINQIEKVANEHRTIVNKLITIVESQIPQKTNDYLLNINELLEKPLNHFVSNEIQSNLSNLFEINSVFDKIIEDYEQTTQNEYQQINDSINKQKTIIYQFSNLTNTYETSHILNDTLNEVSRLNDKIVFNISDKLKYVENEIVLKSTSATRLKENLEFISTSLDDQINSSIAQTNYLIDNEYHKLSELIQFESTNKNKNIYDQLSTEIQNLSNKINSTISDYNETIEQSSTSMKLSIEEFEKTFHDAVNNITNDSKTQTSEITERLNKAFENSQKNFEMFRNEINATVDEIRKKSDKDDENLQKKIEEELHIINQNSIDVQKKFNNIILLVENERKIQLHYFFNPNKAQRIDNKDQKESVFMMDAEKIIKNNLAPEISFLSSTIECINSVENRLNHLESFLEKTKTQFNHQYNSINDNLNEATEKIDTLKSYLKGDDKNTKSLSHIEKLIDAIEKRPKNKFNQAQKSELKALELVTQTAMNDKIKSAKNKIDQINHQIEMILLEKQKEDAMKTESLSKDDSDDYSDESAF